MVLVVIIRTVYGLAVGLGAATALLITASMFIRNTFPRLRSIGASP
jgi:hypothetical protein